MRIFHSSVSLQKSLFPLLEKGKSIGFVPTMGALHRGHVSLVEQAAKENECVVISIFVNPTQFNNTNDLEKYPKSIEEDLILLENIPGDIFVFSPKVSDLYGQNIVSKKYTFEGIENEMEGKHRKGHFDGVGTVLNILFRTVKPTNAYFGEKDFQQLQIVKKLVEIEKLPISIIGCAIIREKNGLAMSSRNKRLNPKELEEATFIYKTLVTVQQNFNHLTNKELKNLVENNFKKKDFLTLEYFEIVDIKTLKSTPSNIINTTYRAFIACFIGGVRLIDNIALN